MVERYEHPIKEALGTYLIAILRGFVEDGIFLGNTSRNILIQNKWENRKHSENGGVAKHKHSIIDGQRYKIELNDEDCLHYRDYHTSMDNELSQQGTAFVCQSAMPVY